MLIQRVTLILPLLERSTNLVKTQVKLRQKLAKDLFRVSITCHFYQFHLTWFSVFQLYRTVTFINVVVKISCRSSLKHNLYSTGSVHFGQPDPNVISPNFLLTPLLSGHFYNFPIISHIRKEMVKKCDIFSRNKQLIFLGRF